MPMLCGVRKDNGSLVSCKLRRPAAVAVHQVAKVVNLMSGTVSGQLVMTVIDKSTVVLYYEDAVAYKKRLLTTYICRSYPALLQDTMS